MAAVNDEAANLWKDSSRAQQVTTSKDSLSARPVNDSVLSEFDPLVADDVKKALPTIKSQDSPIHSSTASPLPNSEPSSPPPAPPPKSDLQSSSTDAPTSLTEINVPSSSSLTPNEVPFDFQKFLDQMKTKSAEPVAKYLRSFLTNFSKKSFSVNDQIKLIHDFLDFIVLRMRECEVWRNASSQEFDNACEAMEKLVMNRFTFTPQIDRSVRPITTDDLERDYVLRQRIRLFGWIREEHLEIPTGEGSQGFMSFAQQELLKINHYKAPRDKLICVLNCCKVIFGLIRHLKRDEGADSFVPLLIFIVLKANPEHLLSNVEYISRFRRAEKLQSEAGYYLSSLMGAISFIETMDHTSLSQISQAEFERNVEEAIQNLPTTPTPSSPTQAPRGVQTYIGEESARPLTFSTSNAETSFAEDTRRFLQRTGETISKPMNLIGKIFADALDGLEDSTVPSRDVPRRQRTEDFQAPWPASSEPQYAAPYPAPYQARVRPSSSSPRRLTPDPNVNSNPVRLASPAHLLPPTHASRPRTPDVAAGRPASPMDFSAMQQEIDRAHQAASDAARETLLSIFPSVEPEVAEMVLEANSGDLGLSIDKLLEMGVAG